MTPFLLSVVAALTMGSLSARPTAFQSATRPPLLQVVPASEFRSEDGPQALLRIATLAGLRIEIEPTVRGTVTVSLREGPAETALRDLTERLDSEFSVDAGGVKVFRKGMYGISEEIDEFFRSGPSEGLMSFKGVSLDQALRRIIGDRIPYRISPGTSATITRDVHEPTDYDAFLALLRHARLRFRVQAGALTVYRPPVPSQRSFEYRNAPVRNVLRLMFLDEGLSYSIAPEVQGEVTVAVANLSFEEAIKKVLRQANARYRVENGHWEIFLAGGQGITRDLPKRTASPLKSRLRLPYIPEELR
ncbi:MAG: hypothetical protein ACO1SV_03400 [Fimbriimonas sp.]